MNQLSLYTIYNFCNSLFPLVPAHIVALFCLVNNLSLFTLFSNKKRSNNTFLDIFKDIYGFYELSKFWFITVFVLSAIVILFSNSYFVTLLGSKDLRTMPEGTYCYYVEATSEYNKTYTLPAKIEKINSNYYQVENVYFKNGGYLYFEDNDLIEFTDKNNAYDQNGKEWNIKITNKKSFHDKVIETKPNYLKNLWIALMEVVLIFFTMTMTILYSIKNKRQVY